jgi:hypothetical protein
VHDLAVTGVDNELVHMLARSLRFGHTRDVTDRRGAMIRTPASLGVCLRWLPPLAPRLAPVDSLDCQAESHQRRFTWGPWGVIEVT